MGVMECNRIGCENVLCDHYSKVTGYLCWECKRELEKSNPKSIIDVKKFMLTEKGETTPERFSLSKLFEGVEDED